MTGKKVAVYTGSYYLPELRERYPQVEFEEHDFSLETAFSLWTRHLDGAIVPQNGANYFQKTYLASQFKIAASLSLPPLRIAMATNAHNQILLSIINKALIDIPPQSIDTQLSSWQMRHAQERFDLWGRYGNALLIAAIITILVVGVIFWRNRFLKRNVAELERLQAALQEAKRLAEKASESKSTFLSQMSHEIRTPMNALTGLLELEYLGKSSPVQRQNNIAVAYESSKSLMMLVGDILDMAKIESGTMTVRRVAVSLPETLNSIATLFRSAAEDKQVTLTTSLEIKQATIMFDPIMLRQIMSNLLSNAIKFTPAGGQVEVALYQGQGTQSGLAEYALEVGDSGPGLTDEQQSAIFEPFVQTESGVEHKGTGLGLSICRQLAELLGGKLTVDSVPDEGATFIFRFSAPVATVVETECVVDVSEPLTEGKKILVVDDHAPNRLLLSQQLESAGHHCVVVESGDQALSVWRDAVPVFDMVITDCNMPRMSGFELTRRFRELERELGIPAMPIFGLTAMAEEAVARKAKESGMTDCLFKPVDLNRLLARIADSEEPTGDLPERRIILSLEKMANAQPGAFQDLLLTVIEQNQQDIAALQQAVELGDLTMIRDAAHSILNSARMIDADALTQASRRLETACEEQDMVAVLSLAECCVKDVTELDAKLKLYLPTE
jgi:two-component system sensor histidine kinase EvgS